MLTRIWGEYRGLSLYEIVFKANFALLKGEIIPDDDKRCIVNRFLEEISSEETVKRFHKGVNAPLAENGDLREMYPLFFITPYDEGRKYVTLSTITPKTHILSANAYELEILRLLAIFARDNGKVKQMLERTKKRLKTTCFGNFCEMGECFETSIIVLRFLGTAYPDEIEWMQKLINGIRTHLFDKKRHSGVVFYYWLALSELSYQISQPEIERFSVKCDEQTKQYSLLNMVQKSFVMNSDHDKYASPFGAYVIRNCLSRLSEFSYMKSIEPYISENDGRLHISNQINITGG